MSTVVITTGVRSKALISAALKTAIATGLIWLSIGLVRPLLNAEDLSSLNERHRNQSVAYIAMGALPGLWALFFLLAAVARGCNATDARRYKIEASNRGLFIAVPLERSLLPFPPQLVEKHIPWTQLRFVTLQRVLSNGIFFRKALRLDYGDATLVIGPTVLADSPATVAQRIYRARETLGPRMPFVPGSPHPRLPNVEVLDMTGKLRPAAGFNWVNSTGGDYTVRYVDAGKHHRRYRNVVYTMRGTLVPAQGYEWKADKPRNFRVRRVKAGAPAGRAGEKAQP